MCIRDIERSKKTELRREQRPTRPRTKKTIQTKTISRPTGYWTNQKRWKNDTRTSREIARLIKTTRKVSNI